MPTQSTHRAGVKSWGPGSAVDDTTSAALWGVKVEQSPSSLGASTAISKNPPTAKKPKGLDAALFPQRLSSSAKVLSLFIFLGGVLNAPKWDSCISKS